MSATILDAIQGLATPAMIKTAASTFGISDAAATSALGAASTSILGGLLQKSSDMGMLGKIAALAGGVTPDASMFANVAGMLSGGAPASPIHMMGNKLLGLVFGEKSAAMISAVAATAGVSSKAASGITSLAAPMVLTALRTKLGTAPTAAGLVSLLSADRNLIATAMPPALRTIYGLTTMAPAAAPVSGLAAAPTTAAAPVAAAAPIAAAAAAAAASVATSAPSATMHPPVPAPVVAPVVAKPSVAATAPPVAAAPAPIAPAPMAPTPVTPAPVAAAPVAHSASGTVSAPMAPVAPTAVPKSAPVAAAAAATAAASATVRSASAPMAAPVAQMVQERSSTNIATLLGIAIPLAIFTALIWYWAYGLDGGRSAISAVKTAAAPAAVAPVAKPAAPAPTPPPEVKKVEAAPAPAPVAAPAPAPVAAVPVAPVPVAPVAVPSANGMVKYTLPGGAAIDVGKDGVEAKLLGFITNKDAAIDKKLWFNFDRLSFDTGSTSLTADSKAQIGTVAAILKAYPAVAVKIGGYTDNQGDPEANMKLSAARAKKVMEEIAGSGISAERVESEGYGEQFPVGDNATPEGRAQNRRTSLSVRQK